MARRTDEDLLAAAARRNLLSLSLFHALADRLRLNVRDTLCLTVLALEGARTPSELARLLSVTSGGGITGIIDRLQRRGLVRRTRDARDRRRVVVEPVPENLAPFVAHLRRVGDALARLADDLPDDRLDLLVRRLRDEEAAAADRFGRHEG
jgi:DNA-binding MarR family transcriptional regulator